jgi:acylphosphatase
VGPRTRAYDRVVKRVRVVVTGRVQGVFFRATCAREARDLGLAGSVRNLPDGRVEAVFEGPEAVVDRMVGWCRLGPEYARVDAVEVTPEPPAGERGFAVTG